MQFHIAVFGHVISMLIIWWKAPSVLNHSTLKFWDFSKRVPVCFGWWLITLHSTITCLTLTRSLDGSDGQIKTLTLYSDPYPNTNQNPNPNHSPNPNPNVKFDILPHMVMSRDITWQTQFLAHNFSEKHFNTTSCGVIRNQRSKIRRYDII